MWYLLAGALKMAGDEVKPDENVERDALQFLTSVDDAAVLKEICDLIELTVPATAVGKSNDLLKLLLRFLNSQDMADKEDGGLSLFLLVRDFLSPKTEENISVKSETVETVTKVKPTFDVLKLKDFKISGTIGGPEKKDSLSYSSLIYQMNNGKKLGYADELICAAVLRAISPGNNLRTYLECKKNLTVNSLLDIMRSHFREKDSTTVFTELSNAAQDLTENCLDFVLRMMCLRQKVLDLGEEEGCPFDKKLVQTRFLHTLGVGIRNNNIRGELREILNNIKTLDEDLLKSVTEAVANETERSGKLNIKKRDPVVNVVEADKTVEKKKRENHLQIQIQELKANQEKELAALRNDLQEIKSTLADNFSKQNSGGNMSWNNFRDGNRAPPRFRNKRRSFRCRDCETNRVNKCVHCFKCCSSEHRMAECTVQTDQKNGL